MDFLYSIKELIPDYAKDVRLNVDGIDRALSLQGKTRSASRSPQLMPRRQRRSSPRSAAAGVLSPEKRTPR